MDNIIKITPLKRKFNMFASALKKNNLNNTKRIKINNTTRIKINNTIRIKINNIK